HLRQLEVGKVTQGHTQEAFCVLFDRSGRLLFTGSDDRLVKTWCARSGRLLRTLRGHEGEITDLAVGADNALLASSSTDNSVRLWRVADGAPVRLLTQRAAPIHSVSFGPVHAAHWLAVG
ncbi:WD40-repeat-containing domain protein, partial [Pavlovales sp. CCMP2436]